MNSILRRSGILVVLAMAAQSQVATLVERQSRYLLLVRVAGKDTASVVGALSRQVRTLPRAPISYWDFSHPTSAFARYGLGAHGHYAIRFDPKRVMDD